MVRRKPGTILPLEAAILEVATARNRAGDPEFHGFMAAKELRDRDGARALTAHGDRKSVV